MRLDTYLVEKKYFDTRTKAKQAILRGEISIDNKTINKVSYEINEMNLPVKIERHFIKEFVSIGGEKLEKAFNDLSVDVFDLICADIGASTGGFTDCLIQHGAKKVYAIDLNGDLLHPKMKNNSKVHEIIKNAKLLTKNDFDEKLDFICADLSFISEKIILPVIYELLEMDKKCVVLIKPQFEMQERKNFKNGIIKDLKLVNSIKDSIISYALSLGFKFLGITTAPIVKDKNIEFLLFLQK